jgi:hypothetical protein
MKGARTIVVAMVLSNYDHEKNTNNSSNDHTKQAQTMKETTTLMALSDHDHGRNMSNNNNGAKQPRAQKKYQ